MHYMVMTSDTIFIMCVTLGTIELTFGVCTICWNMQHDSFIVIHRHSCHSVAKHYPPRFLDHGEFFGRAQEAQEGCPSNQIFQKLRSLSGWNVQ